MSAELASAIPGGAPITVKIIADSITDGGSRLVTWCWEYPRMIHAEIMTHRALSRNAASSRAIPAKKLRQRVVDAPAMPVSWGRNQAGMQAGAEIDDVDAARAWWLRGRDLMAAHHAEGEALGLHKQIVNRVIETWMTIAVVVSMTDHANLFHLRKHTAAEPNFQVIATLAWELFHNHLPTYRAPGEWHLPYVEPDVDAVSLDDLKKLSTARCARVSYLTHAGVRDPKKDVELHDTLANTASMGADPMHACYDAQTEVLTSTGWKGWPDVSPSDRLATVALNAEIHFAVPKRLVAVPFDGELYAVRGQQLDLQVTPNHNMVVGFRRKDGTWSDFGLIEADTLSDRPCRYLKSGWLVAREAWSNPWGIAPDVWARFIGFFVGDGHAPVAGGNQANFHLRKARKQTFVRGLGLPCRVLESGGFVVELPRLGHWLRRNCYTPTGTKKFPDGALTITRAETTALLEGLRNSDGSVRRQTWTYATTSAHVRDVLQALLHINGLVGSVTTTPGECERADSFRLNISNRTTPRVEVNQTGRSLSYAIDRVTYNGLVYCAETSTGALLVRRNGHVVVCGNSPFEHPAMAVGGRERVGNFEGWKQYRKFFTHENGPDTSARCERCGCWAERHVSTCPNKEF